MKKNCILCCILLSCMLLGACGKDDNSSSGKNQNNASESTQSDTIVYNKKNDYLLEAKKKTYLNYEIDDIEKMFSDNSYRTTEFFKNRDVGVVGRITSISSDGDEFVLQNFNSSWGISCECSSELKEVLKSVSNGDRALVCGTVKDNEYNDFTIKAETITKLDDTIAVTGFSNSNGELCLDMEWKEKTVGSLKYYIASKWKEVAADTFQSGFEYSLSDTEVLRVFYVDYNVVKRQAENMNNNGEEWWSIKEKGEVEDYLTYMLSPEVMKYKTSSEKINGIKYDYYGGIADKSSSGNKNEIYYGIINDSNIVIVAYLYKGDPQYYNEVATLMSTIRIEQ